MTFPTVSLSCLPVSIPNPVWVRWLACKPHGLWVYVWVIFTTDVFTVQSLQIRISFINSSHNSIDVGALCMKFSLGSDILYVHSIKTFIFINSWWLWFGSVSNLKFFLNINCTAHGLHVAQRHYSPLVLQLKKNVREFFLSRCLLCPSPILIPIYCNGLYSTCSFFLCVCFVFTW